MIDAIRPVAPTRMYVACDGPNPERPGETEKVAATRAVIEDEIDWPCKIERLYSDTNQGCRVGVSSAITWFFAQVEEGIILEDDCVPHPDFFAYCASLLERYREDMRIWGICGSNVLTENGPTHETYYFSKYCLVWGWATWRSRWKFYDANISTWPQLRESAFLRFTADDCRELQRRLNLFDILYYRGRPDTWDYQWFYTCLINSGLSVHPPINLISNIGFGIDATHTTEPQKAPRPLTWGLKNLSEPLFLVRDKDADRNIWDYHLGGIYYRQTMSLFSLAKRKLGSGRKRAKAAFKEVLLYLFPRLGAENAIKSNFYSVFGYALPATPRTLSEKIHYRMLAMLRSPNPLLSILCDKFTVREPVSRLIGANHLIPLLWSGCNPRAIPFEDLPDRCIAKVTNGSSRSVVIERSSDREAVIKKLHELMRVNHYWVAREYQYYMAKTRLVIEPFMEDGYPEGPLDYRFWCFDGQPLLIQIDNNSHSINSFYDIRWNKLEMGTRPHARSFELQEPPQLQKMIMIARKLAAGFGFVRVDLYVIHGNVYFGELTFTPAAGAFQFHPNSWNASLGEAWTDPDLSSLEKWLKLPRS